MKKPQWKIAITALFLLAAGQAGGQQTNVSIPPSSANQGSVLSGMPALACEAILCLSSPARPTQCQPSLSHYFGIQRFTWVATFIARLSFLEMCPVVSQDPNMKSLVRAIASGAGYCDVSSLNAIHSGALQSAQRMGTMNTTTHTLPSYCNAIFSHPYTQYTGLMPVFVGNYTNPNSKWVEQKDYSTALAAYNQANQFQQNFPRRWP